VSTVFVRLCLMADDPQKGWTRDPINHSFCSLPPTRCCTPHLQQSDVGDPAVHALDGGQARLGWSDTNSLDVVCIFDHDCSISIAGQRIEHSANDSAQTKESKRLRQHHSTDESVATRRHKS
jgi:hypothetical protein